MSTRALVTGASGFVAQWAMQAMLDHGWDVTAASHGPPATAAVLSPEQQAAVHWRDADMTNQAQVRAVVEAARADVVLHLAAISHVPDAANDPAHAFDVNAVGTVRLLAEIGRHRMAGSGDPIVLVIGSA